MAARVFSESSQGRRLSTPTWAGAAVLVIQEFMVDISQEALAPLDRKDEAERITPIGTIPRLKNLHVKALSFNMGTNKIIENSRNT
jgi:hypothetical protein